MSTGFLITTLSGKLRRINEIINQHVVKKLYIYVPMYKNNPSMNNNEWMSRKIVDLYSSSFHLFPNLDVRIILTGLKTKDEIIPSIREYNVDVIIIPKTFNEENISEFRDYIKNMYVVYIDGLMEDEEQAKENKKNEPTVEDKPLYKNVVLGGTFDRLHTGHKILLTEALLRCKNKLTVGVTDGDLIKGKKLWELIEPCNKRISAVERFIKEVDRTVTYDVVSITDMYGPTKSDPNLDLIVVSSETTKGGLKVNELRKKNGLKPLEMHIVRLAQDFKKKASEEEDKISSSNLRMRILGTYLKPPEAKCYLPPGPYVIGLTGGLASGKSTISEYLKKMGAGTIDCDKIGHQLYRCGTHIYFELVHIFGNRILAENGDINRKALGDLVFNNKAKLELLNNLMWPCIYQEARKECDRLYNKEGKEIVILEAAVLLQAGWQACVHEVWGTIIPKEEAVTRLMNRNNFTQEEATLRIESQIQNAEVVANSNIIFCTLWSQECTRGQVSRAWSALQASRKKMPPCP